MDDRPVKVEFLADHKDAVPSLAGWFYQEWSFFYPDKTVKDFQRMIRKRANRDRTPLTLVAYRGQELLGTVSLKSQDLGTPRNLSPWLTSLYVKEDRRHQGIGGMLVTEMEKTARGLGFRKIYLFTYRLEPYYAKLGWNVKEQAMHQDYLISIMVKDLFLPSQ
jgi:GNAT superfamily N-acetyltransferase